MAKRKPQKGGRYPAGYRASTLINIGGDTVETEFIELAAEMIVRLIGNVGFPIVCVCVMFWQTYVDKQSRAEERGEWLQAIKDMTAVLNEMKGKLGGDGQ